MLSLLVVSAIVVILFRYTPLLHQQTRLERILAENELVVVTRNSPTTYYRQADGPAGMEYELAQLFADHLGVRLTLLVADSLDDLLNRVDQGTAHIAAAGLTVTREREKRFRFGTPYQEITEQLIYNNAHKRPANLSSLGSGVIEVVAHSSHAERLAYLDPLIPELHWKASDDLDSGELLQLLADDIIDYTIADSNEFSLHQRFLLNLRVAFDISEPEPLAWAVRKDGDNSLLLAIQKFFRRIRQNGELDRLIERNYGHVDEFDYVDTRIFRRHIETRLPAYRALFQQAAEKYRIDWRLLAAIGYQESHWNPRAISPTGVRGIMMLTRKTAQEMGVKDRRDPASSIEGGARYLRKMLDRLGDGISQPDRNWLAMAAYNVGFYHLKDARKITRLRGKNDKRWVDVKASLPLLAQKKWYRKTRYGYARGWEPVQYVENIRSYYDILKWHDEGERATTTVPERFLKTPNSL